MGANEHEVTLTFLFLLRKRGENTSRTCRPLRRYGIRVASDAIIVVARESPQLGDHSEANGDGPREPSSEMAPDWIDLLQTIYLRTVPERHPDVRDSETIPAHCWCTNDPS